MNYLDENGYERGKIEHSNLVHRQIAYEKIYLKNREKYPSPFEKYQVHHTDGDKLNNSVSNLAILTHKQHNEIHGRCYKCENKFDKEDIFCSNCGERIEINSNVKLYIPPSEAIEEEMTMKALLGRFFLFLIAFTLILLFLKYYFKDIFLFFLKGGKV